MLKPINSDAIPEIREKGSKSAERIFAEKTVAEFLDSPDEAAEVTEIPNDYKPLKLAQLMRDAVWKAGFKDKVKVMQRKDKIYITKPPRAKKVIQMPQANHRQNKVVK